MAGAQTGGSFAGEVTDNTGGVLPGVTVEASSPVLIEGTRTAFTDGAGRYTIVDLRPGPYTLTFTLPGFSTVIREELQLPAAFTMTIDAVLRIGGLEETVTVSGAAPVVDVQTNARAEVLDRAILDAVPTGNTLQSTGQLIVGIKLNRPEVGLTTATQQTFMSVHGMSPSQVTVQVDGLNVNSIAEDGAIQNYHNHLASEEMVYETSGMTAETSGGGVRVNMVPRQGGNTVSGQLYFGGSIDAFQADGLEALEPRTVERGVAGLEGIRGMYDLNAAVGGRSSATGSGTSRASGSGRSTRRSRTASTGRRARTVVRRASSTRVPFGSTAGMAATGFPASTPTPSRAGCCA